MPLRRFIIEPESAGERLDRFLSDSGIWPSRAFVQKIIEAGGASIKGKVLKPSHRLDVGTALEVTWEEPRALEVQP
ncbi:MAG TPA: S4 domain-containing protein, partial [Bacillota bacterium]|nr:S4 domain-containing protein [Bacillota bacterium]